MANPFDQFDSGNPFDQFDAPAPKADPKIGQPEELGFLEKYLAPILENMPAFQAGNGNLRGSAIGRTMQGAADPGVALVQLAANALPDATGAPQAVNKRIQDQEAQYQAARASAGSEGVDPMRALGSIAITAPMGAVGPGLVRGAAVGGAAAALDPVRNGGENFWTDKAKDVGIGVATGAVLSPLIGALSRIVSPKASLNPELDLLRKEGVQPTIGQAAGGWANTLEEKAQSLPIVGDAITAMRNRAKEQFNEAAINRAVAPIGERVKGAGHEAVAEAGDKLSGAYREALGSVNHVNFANDRFISKLTELEGMAQGLSPDLQRRFTRALNETVMRKMSPNGSILGADLKAVDSEIGQIAARYSKSSVASEQELGDALKQLQAIFKQEVGEAVPDVAARLKAADTGWANLVRVEGAAKSAKNHDGVFTPAQFNSSVQRSDRSVRGRSVSRGSALGQDLGTAAQNVLGNKYPDSGTMGRAGILTGLIHPALPLSMAAGAGVYTPQVQNLLRYLLTQRPDQAPAVANYLRKLVGPAALLGAPAMAQESH